MSYPFGPRPMDRTRIEEITTEAAWDEAVPLLRQLWSHESESFVRSWADEEEYRLFGLYEETEDGAAEDENAADEDAAGELIGAAGISIQRVVHHVRHVWVHDLVVDEDRRGEGVGSELLAFAAEWGRERDCESVVLACIVENEDALAFYESEGMERWGYVLEREL